MSTTTVGSNPNGGKVYIQNDMFLDVRSQHVITLVINVLLTLLSLIETAILPE